MNRKTTLSTFVVALAVTLLAGVSLAGAQTATSTQTVSSAAFAPTQPDLPPPNGGPSRIGTARPDQPAPSAASATFAHFFLVDPTTSNPWWRSHTVVDTSGGVHVVFYDNDNIYYAHCATNCGNPANWLELPLFGAGSLDSLDEPTLALDPDGHPRLMWYAVYDGDTNYYYAECNANCANSSSSWTYVAVANMGSYGYPESVRYFALDTHGRPRFVYPNYGYPGSFSYLACDAGCTTASNWHTATVSTPGLVLDALQLVFGPSDQPRVLGYDSDSRSLGYVECNGDCSVDANWSSVALFDIGYTYYYGYALRLDTQGRPRIAYYRADSTNNVLHYAWSNTNALTVTGWLSYTLNYPSNSDEWSLDLALDSLGRPRVTFATDQLDLSYVTCTANCESASPTWQQQYIETDDDLEVSYPIPTSPGCLSSSWMIVGYPSLALDTADNANVSYFVKHGQLCYDSQGHPQILYDAKGIRFARPGGSSTPTAPGTVTINGPTIGAVGISYTFTATASPITVTMPITYVWQATGQTAQTHTGRGTNDTASFTWPAGATGQKTITVSASNAIGTVSKSSFILIYNEPIVFDHWVYLPIVKRP